MDSPPDGIITKPQDDPSLTLADLINRYPPLDLRDRVFIPDYRRPAHGGQANVYIGRMGDKRVAVKVLRVPSGNTPDGADWEKSFERRCKRERVVWAAVKHPNISEFLGYSTNLGDHHVCPAMISMWYGHGTSRQYLDRQHQPVDVDVRFGLTEDVLEGLRYLHHLGVVHGDMKPSNILIDDNEVARLCDFGLVKLEDWAGHFGMTTTTKYSGTERYKAPELFPSRENRYSPIATCASDIYALGGVMLEFIAGVQPFKQFKNDIVKDAVLGGYSPATRSDSIDALAGLTEQFWDLLEACWSEASNRPDILSIIDLFTLFSEARPLRQQRNASQAQHLRVDSPIQITPNGHPNKPARFNNLRFERLGILAELEDAISTLQKAVQLTPDDHPDKPALFSNLGAALQSHFERLGILADLEDAISSLQKAVQLTPDDHRDKPGRFSNVGVVLYSRFERLGNLTDLEDTISSLRQAVQLTPDGHSDKPALFSNLGNALQSRFERLGTLTDLEDAILNKRKALEFSPDGHFNKPTLLNKLGNALQSRFERLGSCADLEDAISSVQQAVQLTPDGHPDKPALLSNLGNALQSRFERLGSLKYLEDAISSLQQAVQLTPNGHPDKPSHFSNVWALLYSRYKRLGNLADLEGAISSVQQAVQLTPNGHSDKPALFSNLGAALQSRFERCGVLGDLEDAISSLQQAVQLTPDGHPDKPGWLNNLGGAFVTRFRRLGILGDLESALSALSTAANSTTGPAMVRFKAARAWAKVAETHFRSPLDAFSCAIDLLPRVVWLGLAVTDQLALLADVGGIVRDAVAAAIRYEEYETAVVWAEQGRSIAWQNLLGLRSPVHDLRESHPELASRLHSIAQRLEGSVSQFEMLKASSGRVYRNHSKLAIDWDNLIDEIRRTPNFEGFLRAKSFRQLSPAAHEGPVVILNVNDSRCDALVLVADNSVERNVSAINIPLERFSYEKSRELFQTLTELLFSAGGTQRMPTRRARFNAIAGEAKFKTILRTLWLEVVKPVIEGLAFQTHFKRPPRIWWCATGLLAFLPIHAAGLYDTQEIGGKSSDYVVSSYTPTLAAILDLSDPMAQEDFQVLTVAQASVLGAQPIPKTEDEIKIVQSLTAGARALNLTGKDATVQRVREGMIESHWIHLACHGQQNPDDPMESGFLLHDKILKLSEIVKVSLPKADFAFLSACQTAMGDEKVAEESVHLAAGMLLSGCRGVIATMWSIRDEDAPKIAQEVYSRIFKDGRPDRKEAAYALHEAVKLLRESGAECLSWVPFIHIGR